MEVEVEVGGDETSYDDADADGTAAGTAYVPIKYRCPARLYKYYNGSVWIIESVSVYYMTAEPVYAYYVDRYGRDVTRYIQTLGFHFLTTPLPSTSVMIQCKCQTIGRYSYTDGSPTWTRQWNAQITRAY